MSIDIEEEIIFKMIGYPDVSNVSEQVKQTVREMIAEAQQKADLKIIWQEFDFTIYDNDCITLASGEQFHSPILVDKLRDCEKLALVVMTVGTEFHEYITQVSKEDGLSAFILDAIGSYMAELLSDIVWQGLASRYQENRQNITTYLSPGSRFLPLDGQTVLFESIQPEKIGVFLNESYLMIPQKSLSAIVGIGKNIELPARGHDCSECDRQECFLREAMH